MKLVNENKHSIKTILINKITDEWTNVLTEKYKSPRNLYNYEISELEKIYEHIKNNKIYLIKESLEKKYLFSNENNGVVGITIEQENDDKFIQFNIVCETILNTVNEYEGVKIKFNRLCNID